ncbi:aldehyde dehydrogenase family protein, partial [Escherichia coli]|nr:aldehyde dehydrogenase family protein [Escherichia coli]
MIINRIIVHQDVYDEFVEKFTARVKQLPYGDQTDPKTVVGPLINERQIEKALEIIEQAKTDGIELAVEGK